MFFLATAIVRLRDRPASAYRGKNYGQHNANNDVPSLRQYRTICNRRLLPSGDAKLLSTPQQGHLYYKLQLRDDRRQKNATSICRSTTRYILVKVLYNLVTVLENAETGDHGVMNFKSELRLSAALSYIRPTIHHSRETGGLSYS